MGRTKRPVLWTTTVVVVAGVGLYLFQPVKQDGGGNLDDGTHVDLGDLMRNEGNQNYLSHQRKG